jgi:MFS family permease
MGTTPLHARFRILAPLAVRDFRLLWTGMSVSLFGDGVQLVAVAWLVYDLSNAPAALSLVGVAWTLPQVLLLLAGGVVSDRVERRLVMIAGDLVRLAAMGSLAALVLTGAVELWHVVALVGLHGVGTAFFQPAFGAVVPQIVPPALLVEANSLDQLMRPFAFQLVGPAVGGVAVAALGAGQALALDACTFALSAIAIGCMRRLPRATAAEARRSALSEVREGFAFVRSQTWLWGSLAAFSASLLAFWGPYEVLIPYLVKNELGGGADDLGLIFASGGVGSMVVAVAMAQRGLPRRHIVALYGSWAVASAAIAGFALATASWHAMAASVLVGAGSTIGMVIWGTMMHRLVPGALLGRVTSMDWLVTTSLVPISFAITAPVAGLLGVRATLAAAGLVSGAVVLAFLLVPGIRDTEHHGLERRADAATPAAEPVREPGAEVEAEPAYEASR